MWPKSMIDVIQSEGTEVYLRSKCHQKLQKIFFKGHNFSLILDSSSWFWLLSLRNVTITQPGAFWYILICFCWSSVVLSGVWWSLWLCVITVLLCLPAVWRHWAVRCQSRRTTTPSTSTRTGGTSSKASRGRSRNNQPPGQSRIIQERQKQRQRQDRTQHSIFLDLTYHCTDCNALKQGNDDKFQTKYLWTLSRWQKLRVWVKGNGKLFVVKPVLVIMMMIVWCS